MVYFCWSRLASAQWEDAWRESLLYLGAERLAVFVLPGRKRIRVELYNLTKNESEALVQNFGGQARRQPTLTQQLAARPPRPPIRIRQRLTILDEEAPLPADCPRTLHIPAGLAFGTGDHATTASCLRLLVDASRGWKKWSMLDLGTGSGILALAARKLGATPTIGYDYDADSVRVAKGNAARNGLRGITFGRRDVTQWQPERTFELVAANLFAQVLIVAAPAIAAALAPGGRIILSGILRPQEKDTLAAFAVFGLEPCRTIRRGKWCTALLATDAA